MQRKAPSQRHSNNSASTYTVWATNDGVEQSFSGATEWQLASEQNIQQNTKWPDVDWLATWLRPNHFRWHIVCCSHITFKHTNTVIIIIIVTQVNSAWPSLRG